MDGTPLYFANRFSNTVSVIDTTTNTVLATVPVGNYPSSVAVAGDRLYATNYNDSTVRVFDHTVLEGVLLPPDTA